MKTQTCARTDATRSIALGASTEMSSTSGKITRTLCRKKIQAWSVTSQNKKEKKTCNRKQTLVPQDHKIEISPHEAGKPAPLGISME
jgi:hypothetical protein